MECLGLEGIVERWIILRMGMSWIQASQVSDLHGHLHHLSGHFTRRSLRLTSLGSGDQAPS